MSLYVKANIEVPSFSVQVDCSISPGITALTGPSGSGKSLTVAAIAGLVRPKKGCIKIEDVVVFDGEKNIHLRSQERKIGMVFQAPSLLDHRSPLDNVAIAAVGQKKSVRIERAKYWLARVGAEHLASKNTRQLSGGERQRIALARALVNGCSVLLLDEPFTALDRQARSQLRQLVVEIVKTEEITAVVVTHDVDDIVAMASHIVLFEPGATVGTFPVDQNDPMSVLNILGHRETHK